MKFRHLASYGLAKEGDALDKRNILDRKNRRNVRRKTEHDYFEGDITLSNSFTPLRDDLKLSDNASIYTGGDYSMDDEEHQEYVRTQNSVHT